MFDSNVGEGDEVAYCIWKIQGVDIFDDLDEFEWEIIGAGDNGGDKLRIGDGGGNKLWEIPMQGDCDKFDKFEWNESNDVDEFEDAWGEDGDLGGDCMFSLQFLRFNSSTWIVLNSLS